MTWKTNGRCDPNVRVVAMPHVPESAAFVQNSLLGRQAISNESQVTEFGKSRKREAKEIHLTNIVLGPPCAYISSDKPRKYHAGSLEQNC
ncbi:jg2167 [Pararge aegeria aegeria]|uniref:Jg2167 protein n=1 Tax=Pararge aegeria aegeria TaxID=348720 RepID=A0A8S4QMN2_9NEOP|nr:jg2167 [Pararge aegeria aegeria]